jgi:ribosomal-protein-alanine N-acetyltransferase
MLPFGEAVPGASVHRRNAVPRTACVVYGRQEPLAVSLAPKARDEPRLPPLLRNRPRVIPLQAPTEQERTQHMDRSNTYFLKTARLGFSRWSMDDFPLAVALWGDPEVTQFLGGAFSPEEIQERLGREIALMSAHNIQYWPVFLLAGDAHVGCGGLRPYRLEDGVYEMGVHLRSAYWGQGLAAEAGHAIIAFAFETLGAQALFAGHHPANEASRRVLSKLGFQFTHLEFYAPTGLQHPSYLLKRTE